MSDRQSGQLGIDIGGTKVAFIVRPGSAGGRGAGSWQRELRRRCWPSSGGLSADIAALRTWCRQAGSSSIGSVGTSVPATLDPDGRVSTWPNRPHWTGFALADFLRREFPGARVSWGDDGNLAALAEARESGTPDLAYLGVGTGIGGGLVLGGQVIPRLGDGCEIGHMIVAAGGAVCTCGRRGCVQAVASGPATLRRAELASGRRVGADELDDGFARQAEWAIQAVTESAQALACAVVNVAELLKIGLVRIGGGFASALTCLVPAVAAHTARLGRPGHPPPLIEPAVLGSDSSLHGALLLAQAGGAESCRALAGKLPSHGRLCAPG